MPPIQTPLMRSLFIFKTSFSPKIFINLHTLFVVERITFKKKKKLLRISANNSILHKKKSNTNHYDSIFVLTSSRFHRSEQTEKSIDWFRKLESLGEKVAARSNWEVFFVQSEWKSMQYSNDIHSEFNSPRSNWNLCFSFNSNFAWKIEREHRKCSIVIICQKIIRNSESLTWFSIRTELIARLICRKRGVQMTVATFYTPPLRCNYTPHRTACLYNWAIMFEIYFQNSFNNRFFSLHISYK